MGHRLEQHQIAEAQFLLRCLSFGELGLYDELIGLVSSLDKHRDFVATEINETAFVDRSPLLDGRIFFGQKLSRKDIEVDVLPAFWLIKRFKLNLGAKLVLATDPRDICVHVCYLVSEGDIVKHLLPLFPESFGESQIHIIAQREECNLSKPVEVLKLIEESIDEVDFMRLCGKAWERFVKLLQLVQVHSQVRALLQISLQPKLTTLFFTPCLDTCDSDDLSLSDVSPGLLVPIFEAGLSPVSLRGNESSL